jgi:histidinol dehydrogenase
MTNNKLMTLVEKLKQVLIEAEKVSLSKEQRTDQIIKQRKKLFKFIIKYIKEIGFRALDNFSKVDDIHIRGYMRSVSGNAEMAIYYIDNDFNTAIQQAKSFLYNNERDILQIDNITLKENKITFDKLYNTIMEKL